MAKNLQLVVFGICKELYGVSIESIKEIVRVPYITEVPDAPVYLEGVINLRGRVVPIIDLRKRLHLGGGERTKSTRILIVEGDNGLIGLLVDLVAEVKKVTADAMEAPPEMISAIGIEYITGVVKIEEKLVILLDLKEILGIESMKKIKNAADLVAEQAA
jgi:purine-binding chemotaxis protein CheW